MSKRRERDEFRVRTSLFLVNGQLLPVFLGECFKLLVYKSAVFNVETFPLRFDVGQRDGGSFRFWGRRRGGDGGGEVGVGGGGEASARGYGGAVAGQTDSDLHGDGDDDEEKDRVKELNERDKTISRGPERNGKTRRPIRKFEFPLWARLD